MRRRIGIWVPTGERPAQNQLMPLTSVSPESGAGSASTSNENALHSMLDRHADDLTKQAKPEVKKRSVMDELLVHEHHHHAHHKFVLREFFLASLSLLSFDIVISGYLSLSRLFF